MHDAPSKVQLASHKSKSAGLAIFNSAFMEVSGVRLVYCSLKNKSTVQHNSVGNDRQMEMIRKWGMADNCGGNKWMADNGEVELILL